MVISLRIECRTFAPEGREKKNEKCFAPRFTIVIPCCSEQEALPISGKMLFVNNEWQQRQHMRHHSKRVNIIKEYVIKICGIKAMYVKKFLLFFFDIMRLV